MAITNVFQKKHSTPDRGDSIRSSFTATGDTADIETEKGPFDDESKVPFMTARTFFMAVLVSFGGLCFGYDTGQISGFLEMDNFLERFADEKNPPGFSNVRSGLIVGMVSSSDGLLSLEADGGVALNWHTYRRIDSRTSRK